jgi:hypothetical protein
MNDRPLSPSPSHLVISDHEFRNRSAPPGRMPVAGPKTNDHRGGSDWTPIGAGTPAAVAGQAERDFRRERPDIQARREAKGK